MHLYLQKQVAGRFGLQDVVCCSINFGYQMGYMEIRQNEREGEWRNKVVPKWKKDTL